jgi:hypothetical protein
MTSCARRWISGLPRCTLSKSSAAVLLPAAIELAAPPPMPMRMPGPAQLHQQRAGAEGQLVRLRRSMRPRPPAIMMGLW